MMLKAKNYAANVDTNEVSSKAKAKASEAWEYAKTVEYQKHANTAKEGAVSGYGKLKAAYDNYKNSGGGNSA